MNLVAYSTPKPAYTVLDQDFATTKAGSGVTISPSFGPSGTQATSVVDGLPADVVNFSLEPDMAKLVKAGLVSSSWDKGADQGHRDRLHRQLHRAPGEPQAHHDLGRPGEARRRRHHAERVQLGQRQVEHHGGLRRRANAGQVARPAETYLSQLLHNAVAQPSSGSAALQTFLSGQGDVLLDYESDALYAKSKGEPVDIITPPQTILIQNPIAVTKTASPSAKAFVTYLHSPAGQKVWGQQGYRPVLPSVAEEFKFPQPKTLFTIDALGGWTSVNTKFFDPTTGIVAKVEQNLGVSTASG